MDYLRLTSLIVVCIASIVLALSVYLRNRKNPSHRAFAAAVFSVVLWLLLSYAAQRPEFALVALSLSRLALATAIAASGFLLNFALTFPTAEMQRRMGWRLFLASYFVFSFLTAFTPLVISGVVTTGSQTSVLPGRFYTLVAAWVVAGVLMPLAVLVLKFRSTTGRARAQIAYVLLGVTLFSVVSLVASALAPLIPGANVLASTEIFSVLVLVSFTAYAMVKHRFMDVRLVVLRGAVYVGLIMALGIFLASVATLARAQLTQVLSVDPEVLFAVTTVLAVLGFAPIARGLERLTDRYFYRRTYDPQKLLSTLGSQMSATLDVRDLALILSEELREEMRLTFSAVVLNHAATLEGLGAGVTLPSDALEPLMKLSGSGEMLFADDLETDPEAAARLAEHQVRVLAPLSSGGSVLGALVLGDKLSGEMFTSDDATFLEILCGEAAVCVRNALLFDDRNQRVRELSALNTLSWALGRDTQFDAVLERALNQVMQVTDGEAGSIMLVEPDGRTLRIGTARGLPSEIVQSTCVQMGEGIAGWVAKHRKPLILVDAQPDNGFEAELASQGIRSALSVPLVSKGDIIGVLNVSKTKSPEAFTKQNLKVVASFAGQLAVAIENARLYVDLENTFLGTIGALAAAVDAKDPYTYGHSSEVTEHTIAIAHRMGLSTEEIEKLRIGALLHDIGKIGIDGAILNKPGRLTDEEFEIIKGHPDIAANILSSLEFLTEVVPLVRHHHEHYAGGGYPSGIAGDEIPLGARIIAVADAFNAMTSDRPYRASLAHDVAIRELIKHSGTQFDPEVVRAFLRVAEVAASA